MKNKSTSDERVSVEPSGWVRFFGDQYYTIFFTGLGIAVLTAWVMLDMVRAERPIPVANFVVLAVGLLLVVVCGIVRLGWRAELDEARLRRRLLREAKALLREERRGERRYRHRLTPGQIEDLRASAGTLAAAAAERRWDDLPEALNQLDQKLDAHLAYGRKSTAREYAESIGIAVLVALFLRSFVVEAFRIPSGSMIPTLQVGDHIFVNKFIYGVRIPWTDIKLGMGWRKPERGEVIVFKFPRDPAKDFIKRIVGIEGDVIEVRQDILYVNGNPVERVKQSKAVCEYDDKVSEESERWEHRFCTAYRETLGRRSFTTIYDVGVPERSWPQVRVPPGNVFVMGDNRDNSHDSRYWGFVPASLIKGRAMVIWWSSGQPEGIRLKRMGRTVQ